MWTQEKTLRLIELWQQTPILWDSKLKDYRNRDLKRVALEDISNEFDLTALDIEKKLTGLKNQFRREHNKMKSNVSGTAYSVEWFGYRPLKFLLDSFNPRESWEVMNENNEFPELSKASAEICIDSDIFLHGESFLEMKEEKDDPPSDDNHAEDDRHSDNVSIVYQTSTLPPQEERDVSPLHLQNHKRRKTTHHSFLDLERTKLQLEQQQQHQPQIQIKPFPFPGENLKPSAHTILKTFTSSDSLQINSTDNFSSKHLTEDKKTIHHPHSPGQIMSPSTSHQNRDEFAVYGDYVANCLRKYRDSHSVLVAQNKINNVLFDGAIGRFSFFSTNADREHDNTLQVILNQQKNSNHRPPTVPTHLSECSSTKRD